MNNKEDRNQDTEKQEHQDEYHFLKEVIKEKPVDKRKIIKVAVGITAGAILFGVVSAFVFAKALPMFEPEEQDAKVTIPEETPTPTQVAETPTVQPDDASGEVSDGADTPGEESESGITLEDYTGIYQQVLDVAKTPESSIVTVQGITNDVDWMNNSYENEKQVSGFLAADNGSEYFVLTEYRAVDQVDRILVTFSDGTSVDAHFQKQDQGTGLAVLKIPREDVSSDTRKVITVAELGSSAVISRGEPVLALGSPAGYSGSISYGMVTSVKNMRSTVDNEYHILTTDILGDSEGSGVLVNLDGAIVGVIVQSFSMENTKNVVTALPISELKDLIEKLSNNENLIYLGVWGQDIGSDLSQKTGIPKGVYVSSVDEDSPAMAAGIQNGDVIVKIKDNSVETLLQLRKEIDRCKADQKISVTAMRKGAEGYVEIVFDVTVGAL
ncbi:MAG: serine protease [Clostridia bacterium]|nr:serine protease [Clostridia bacterium]NCC43611.1 serine protease [Clostridia bacterium]